MKNAKSLLAAIVVVGFLIVGVYGVLSSPPKPVEKHEHEEEQNQNVVTETLGQIDIASAKSVTFFISDMDTPQCAQEIAQHLSKAGGVGEVTVDLSAKTYKIQYDPNQMDENKLKQVIAASEHTPEIKK